MRFKIGMQTTVAPVPTADHRALCIAIELGAINEIFG